MRIILLFALMLTLGSTVFACDCNDLTPQQSLKEADVVFEGELIRSAPITDRPSFGRDITYTFRVSHSLKGPAVSEITLVGGHTDCDFYFFPNIVYRVYARRDGAELFTGSCLANQVLRTNRISSHVGMTTFPWRSWYTTALIIAGICLATLLIVRFLLKGLRPQKG